VEATLYDRPQNFYCANARAASQLSRRAGQTASHLRRKPMPLLVQTWAGARKTPDHRTGPTRRLQVIWHQCSPSQHLLSPSYIEPPCLASSSNSARWNTHDRLYHEVRLRGGMTTVVEKKMWSEVARAMDMESSHGSGSSAFGFSFFVCLCRCRSIPASPIRNGKSRLATIQSIVLRFPPCYIMRKNRPVDCSLILFGRDHVARDSAHWLHPLRLAPSHCVRSFCHPC